MARLPASHDRDRGDLSISDAAAVTWTGGRRAWLQQVGIAGAAWWSVTGGNGGRVSWAQGTPAVAQPQISAPGAGPSATPAAPIVAPIPYKELQWLTANPFNGQPSLTDLSMHWLTPVENFFVRSHGAIPMIDTNAFRLEITGLVERPVSMSLDELLSRFRRATVTATLTCAGNRRIEFAQRSQTTVAGVPWGAGAIGNAEWAGVRLSDVLDYVGVKSTARYVWFEGRDEIKDGEKLIGFGGMIPVETALADRQTTPRALLATHMNQAPLTPVHGAPLRSVVPGYIGARSVKWLGKITLSDQPSPNRFVARDYKLITTDTPEALQQAAPVNEYVLNALIAPVERPRSPNQPITVRGFALASGEPGRRVAKVEWSVDQGASWQPARLESSLMDFCWVLWSADVPWPSQPTVLMARATDDRGQTQPVSVPWNIKGYQYNAWYRLPIGG